MTKFPLILISVLLLAGCQDDEVVQGKAPIRRKPQQDSKADTVEDALPPAIKFSEADFIESEGSRDPFHNFAKVFIGEAQGRVSSQHEVIVEEYPIDDLKLVAIISGVKPAHAMLVDPQGLGHTVRRGQYIGRPMVMQPNGGVGAAYEVNWRIDQIRSEDLVLVRDDPSNPKVPSSTMVLPLFGEEAEEIEKQSDGVKEELEAIQKRLAQIAAQNSPSTRLAPQASSLRGKDE